MNKLFILPLLILAQLTFAQGSINWEAPVSLTTTGSNNQRPRVALAASGNPLIIWGDADAGKVYFVRWTGMNFTTPVALNPATIPVFTASWAGPDIAAYGDTVYVVYKHTPEDTNHIYLVYSYNGGLDFSEPVRVDDIGDKNSRFPAVAVDSVGNPVVAFMKFDPGFENARYAVARSSDFGHSFSADVPASGFSGGHVCDCCPATVVAAGNRVISLYRDNLNNLRNMWAGISNDGGNTFPNGLQVDKTNWVVNSCPSSGPDGIIVGDTLYSVFMSAATGAARCYRSKSSLVNLQAGPSMPLTGSLPGLSQQNFPRIAQDGPTAAIVWRQSVSNTGQLALQFADDIRIGFAAGYDTVASDGTTNADVALQHGAIYVVWETDNGKIYYRQGSYATNSVPVVEQMFPAMTIYPNPVVEDHLFVSLSNSLSTPVTYSISNANGQELIAGHAYLENGLLKLTARLPAPGIYVLQITCGAQSFVGKIVKQRAD